MRLAVVAEHLAPPAFGGSTMVCYVWLRVLARWLDEVFTTECPAGVGMKETVTANMFTWVLRRLSSNRDNDLPATWEGAAARLAVASDQAGGLPGGSPTDGLSRVALRSREHRLGEAFTPTRPQFTDGAAAKRQFASSGRRFIGRGPELARIRKALREDRSHVVLYGERGRGKTSLANLAVEEARTQGFPVARYVCSAASNFDAVVRGLARDLPLRSLGIPATAAAAGGTGAAAAPQDSEGLLPISAIQPGDVLALTPRIKGVHLLLVVDEFDRITGEATRTALADALKQVSDRGAPLSFIIIGVSDSLEHLLGRHPSIQRCVTGIPLPLLTAPEVMDVVAQGGRQAGLDYPPAVCAAITALSRGVPFIAQLLSLRAGQAALHRGRTSVGGGDLAAAVAGAVAEMDPRIVEFYERLTAGGQDAAAVALLRATATGVQDEFGHFRVVADPTAPGGLRVAGAPAELGPWRRLLEAGAIRACVGAGPDVFTFDEAMLPHYVLLRAVRDTSGRA